MPPKQHHEIPSNIPTWTAAARKIGINYRTSVHSRGQLSSSSKVPESDIWQVHSRLGLDAQFRIATEHLEGDQSFEDYLTWLRNKTSPRGIAPARGTFWYPYEQQCRVCQLIESNPMEEERAYVSNEELVNASLISFLQAICATHQDVDSYWNPARVRLTLDFRAVKKGKETGYLHRGVFSLSCRVDGFLESRTTFRNQAIVDAKAQKRELHEPRVYWQETVELLTASLSEHPKKRLPENRVTLVSQNGTEIYLLNAVQTKGYRNHMQGREKKHFVKNDEFLRIYKYGPYNIHEERDMTYSAKLALAVALGASEEESGRN